jgi:hypothetical protein
MKDAVATMGGVLPDDASGRDAVHVAVFSAISGVRLFPGQDVGAVSDGEGGDVAVGPLGVPLIGIVDPFLKAPVIPGERFWVFLYPRTITALSHRWSHPAFEDTKLSYAPPSAKLESDLWLTKFCAEYDDKNYGFSMRATLEKIFDGQYDDDEYLTVYGTDEKGAIPYEVWHHASVVFGKPVPLRKPTYFSCSC